MPLMRPLSAQASFAEESSTMGVDPAAGIAVALSGGGVRAAAFALGFLEELDRTGAACPGRSKKSDGSTTASDHVHYVSTVSGGGFAGAIWMSLRKREKSLTDPEGKALIERARQRASYLAPGSFLGPGGAFEGTISYVIGVALNLVAVFAAAGICMSTYALFASLLRHACGDIPATYMIFGALGVLFASSLPLSMYTKDAENAFLAKECLAGIGLSLVAATVLFSCVYAHHAHSGFGQLRAIDLVLAGTSLWAICTGIAAEIIGRVESDRRSRSQSTRRVRRRRRLAVIVAVLLIVLAITLETYFDPLGLSPTNRGVFGLRSLHDRSLLAWRAVFAYLLVAAGIGVAIRTIGKNAVVARPLLGAATSAAAIGAIVLLGVAHGLFFDYLEIERGLHISTLSVGLQYACVCCVVVLVVHLINSFVVPDVATTHHLFRDRIASAFFNEDFDSVKDARNGVYLHDYSVAGMPLWIVNAALNDPAGSQGGAISRACLFTFTPLHCGSSPTDYGYIKTTHFGFVHPPYVTQALTISAAVVAPRMGDYSKIWIAIAANILNLRLGQKAPRLTPSRDYAPLSTALETGFKYRFASWSRRVVGVIMSPFSSVRAHEVYLSDGGHYDNLGVLTLIERKCKFIVAVDAEQDGDYACQGLADVVRKARILHDACVAIDVRELVEASRTNARFAVGSITYNDRSVGTLVYVKSVLIGDEPVDVRNYALRNPLFPHEPTVNQFFSSSQFEAYRSLGALSARSVFSTCETSLRVSKNTSGEWLQSVFEEIGRKAPRALVAPVVARPSVAATRSGSGDVADA